MDTSSWLPQEAINSQEQPTPMEAASSKAGKTRNRGKNKANKKQQQLAKKQSKIYLKGKPLELIKLPKSLFQITAIPRRSPRKSSSQYIR